jgi:hypothetical protein
MSLQTPESGVPGDQWHQILPAAGFPEVFFSNKYFYSIFDTYGDWFVANGGACE